MEKYTSENVAEANPINNLAMQKLASINPATNQPIGHVAISTPAEIIEKVKRAHEAKNKWKALGVKKRIALLKPLIDAFKQKQQEICQLTTQEMGKPITESREDFAADFGYLEAFFTEGEKYLQPEVTVKTSQSTHQIVYEPRGVVACIVPWNYPFTNFLWSVIPNLIVGNTVVFKHSEECPLVGKIFADVMAQLEGIPEGVFSAVYGGGEVGEFLVKQPIDMLMFIGSCSVGKKLFAIAGEKQIKALLEMGGSNPALVFADVDLEDVVPRIYRGRFTNSGQVCDAIKRILVHRSLMDSLVEKLTQYLQNIKVGDPMLESTQIGPLAAMRQLTLLEAQMADAISKGAHVITGGKRVPNLPGAYYQPTLLTHIKTDMRVWQEETFGPVLPILAFDTEEEAIKLANDTMYGLGSVIYSKNLDLAHRVAAQIDAGFVDINAGSHWHPANPFGGFKASGMGCEHGRLGFHELCRFKVIAEE